MEFFPCASLETHKKEPGKCYFTFGYDHYPAIEMARLPATGGLCRSTGGTRSQRKYVHTPETLLVTPVAGSVYLSLINVADCGSCGSAT